LPDKLWVVEFSLPELYTGNRSKLGEVIFEALSPIDAGDPTGSLLALRAPGVLVIREGANLKAYQSESLSHGPLYSAVKEIRAW
jgi:hypothetical protein